MWKWIVATLIFGLIVLELVFFAPQAGDRKTGKDWKDSADQAAVEKDVEQVLSGKQLGEGKDEKE